MRKFLLLLFTLIGFSAFAQEETKLLVVELKTDYYGSETSWKLFNINGDLIKSKSGFESRTVYKDTIDVSADSCYYWTIYDTNGDGISYVNPGYYKLYVDGTMVIESEDADFGNVKTEYALGTCASNEVSVEVSVIDVIGFGEERMRANITNMGPDVINSVELFYKVDDFTSSSAVISGLNLASGKTMEIYHPDLFEFDTPGEYNIRIEVSKVNESVDAFVENNVDAKVIEVLDGFLNKPLFEFVVTSTFDMSYTNNYFEALRTLYPGYTTMLKYPIENDPYMTDEALARATDYYGSVYAYATLIINGEKYTSTSEISDGVFNSFYIGKVTPLKIDLETEVIGDSIFINANVFSREYLADGHKLHLAVAENTTYNNAVGTSGEDEFHAILMRMFPGAEGTEIGSLGANQEFQVSYAASLEGTNIEEYTDLSLVAFVQNDLSMKVLQSGSLALNFKAVAPNLLFNIENDATDIAIDTSIIIKSDMALRQLNDEQIDKIEDFILFKKGNAEGENVSFKAEISDDFKEITIKPSIALNYQTNYYVALSNLENKFDIAIENAFVNFKTTTEPSGIEELESEFSIYPNPASDYVVIKGERINELNIYSTTGQLMLNKAGQMSGQIELQLNDLEKGLYFISIKTDKGTVNQTLVIR